MSFMMNVLVTPSRGAPLEDLGTVSVTPKPARSELVRFQNKGRPAQGIVALIDPSNWEKRPDFVPTINCL